jgi:hypothetical protein
MTTHSFWRYEGTQNKYEAPQKPRLESSMKTLKKIESS